MYIAVAGSALGKRYHAAGFNRMRPRFALIAQDVLQDST